MLDGRTIVVTGAARGLGREIAVHCNRLGANLIISDIDPVELKDTASLLDTADRFAITIEMDLADPSAIEAAVLSIAGHTPSIDGLVNNGAIATGIGGIGFEDIDIDTWDRVMQVNVRGTWLMTRACMPLLEKSDSPRIVNVASDTALWGAPNLLSYVSSKGALMAMTRSLARELGPRKIGITAVAPGILKTESTEYVPEHRHAHYENNRAVTGEQHPQDITDVVAFLLTEGALTLTGQVLPVNHGFVFN